MYFKERQRSNLYKHYQQVQQARLSKKLVEIKSRKLRHCDSENLLPPITHRASPANPLQKLAVEQETERLSKRIMKLKTNKSEYFSKIIGLTLVKQSSKKLKEISNKSAIICGQPSQQQKKTEQIDQSLP